MEHRLEKIDVSANGRFTVHELLDIDNTCDKILVTVAKY